jgi:hypothetical protein
VPVLHEGRVRPARGADKDPGHAFQPTVPSAYRTATVGHVCCVSIETSDSSQPRDRDSVRHRPGDHIGEDRGPSVGDGIRRNRSQARRPPASNSSRSPQS